MTSSFLFPWRQKFDLRGSDSDPSDVYALLPSDCGQIERRAASEKGKLTKRNCLFADSCFGHRTSLLSSCSARAAATVAVWLARRCSAREVERPEFDSRFGVGMRPNKGKLRQQSRFGSRGFFALTAFLRPRKLLDSLNFQAAAFKAY